MLLQVFPELINTHFEVQSWAPLSWDSGSCFTSPSCVHLTFSTPFPTRLGLSWPGSLSLVAPSPCTVCPVLQSQVARRPAPPLPPGPSLITGLKMELPSDPLPDLGTLISQI